MIQHYDKLFDHKKQEEMRNFFIEFSKNGKLRTYKKGEIIKIELNESYICIVITGKVKQFIISKNGKIKTLYFLQPGEIFGEFSYISGGDDFIYAEATEECKVSIVNENELDSLIKKNPYVYKYISHSMCRKFRIVMMQMYDLIFMDSTGKICDLLIRLYSQQGRKIDDGYLIDINLTHEDIANLIGCDRVTVTKVLNRLKCENIIRIYKKKIIIKDANKLFDYLY